MTKQDAINLLTQKDQLQLLSFYDTLTPQQQENLHAQIEGIDWSLLDELKTHQTQKAGKSNAQTPSTNIRTTTTKTK